MPWRLPKRIPSTKRRTTCLSGRLSRAIKELESGLGVTLFDRSAKGMFLTPDGELFVQHAKKALKQVDDIENLFRDGTTAKQQFSVSVPRASYIADAFTQFTKKSAVSRRSKYSIKRRMPPASLRISCRRITNLVFFGTASSTTATIPP